MVSHMEQNDTIRLLKECNAGSKMAVATINEVIERTKDPELKKLLAKSREHHESLGNELHRLLMEQGSNEKDPNPMAKGMSWLKTNVKLGMEESPAAIADLVTDGCNMGIKSLYKYLNQYQAADHTSQEICKKLVSIEEELCRDLRKYL